MEGERLAGIGGMGYGWRKGTKRRVEDKKAVIGEAKRLGMKQIVEEGADGP